MGDNVTHEGVPASLTAGDENSALERFELIAPWLDGPVDIPGMRVVRLYPARRDDDRQRFSLSGFDQGELRSLLSAVLPEAGARLWLHGWCQASFLGRLQNVGLIPTQVREDERGNSTLWYFLQALNRRQLDGLRLPYGFDDSHWWGAEICAGPEGRSERNLKAFVGISPAHLNTSSPEETPDWLP